MKAFEELKKTTKKDIIIDGIMRSKSVYLLVSNHKYESLCSHCYFPIQAQMENHF